MENSHTRGTVGHRRPLRGVYRVCVGAALVGALLAGVTITPQRASAAAGRSVATLSALDTGVLAQLNQIRLANRLTPLTVSPDLSASAAEHSTEMITDGYFAHNSHDGTAFWKRILRFYPEVGTARWSVGENLLRSTGTINATQAMAAWMASPDHRANILNPAWRQIGISAVAATGTDVMVITTDFGAR
jgi:uncharacterized protein YkwD